MPLIVRSSTITCKPAGVTEIVDRSTLRLNATLDNELPKSRPIKEGVCSHLKPQRAIELSNYHKLGKPALFTSAIWKTFVTPSLGSTVATDRTGQRQWRAQHPQIR